MTMTVQEMEWNPKLQFDGDVTDNFKYLMKFGDTIPASSAELQLDQMDTKVLGQSYKFQFDKAVNYFYTTKWKCCYSSSKMLLDITWEHLNTGHWKDVNITWRYAYTYLSLFKAISEYALSLEGHNELTLDVAIKTCDMGLLMGAPVLNNILTKVVAKLQSIHIEQYEKDQVLEGKNQDIKVSHKKRKMSNIPVISPANYIKTLQCPSLQTFRECCMESGEPVIIQGAIDYWPAIGERCWSLDYLHKIAGCRTVPIEIGSKYTEDSWSQKLMTLSHFIHTYIENTDSDTDIGYLAQHQLFDQIPELQRDISIPTYCCLGENDDVDINAWFGPKGTISPLHHDPKHNFLAQVVGHKYIRLYAPKDTEMVYPIKDSFLDNTSQVDVENPDFDKFPLFGKAPYKECILEPGDMLYIPPKYWHYIRSLSVSFSVSFWWE